MSHENLLNRFKTNFAMLHHYKYSLSEIEAMVPWERDVYVDLIKDFIKQEEQKKRDQDAMLQALANKRKR